MDDGQKLSAGRLFERWLCPWSAQRPLDAVGTPWDASRVIGVAEAPFSITPLSVFRWRDVVRTSRRSVGRTAIWNPRPSDRSYTRMDIRPRTLREACFNGRALRQVYGHPPQLVFFAIAKAGRASALHWVYVAKFVRAGRHRDNLVCCDMFNA